LKSVVGGLAALARRAPALVIVGVVLASLVFGFLNSKVTIATGNEGFAPESQEIAATERIQDYFGSDSRETTLQIVIRRPGGDVITVEGLRAAMAAADAVRASELGPEVSDRPERPGVIHFMSVVEQAMAFGSLTIDDMTDEMVKAMYAEAFDGDGVGDLGPEESSFLSRLVSADFEPDAVTASGGMALVFVTAFDGDSEEAFTAQTEAEKALAEDLAALDTGVEIRPFSFFLLFSGIDEFTQEVGRLFATAFVVILAILLVVFWLPRGARRRDSVRRTVADTVVTLVTILLAVTWTQGIGYLLLEAGIIDAFSAVTQVVPILLIGLGVDYAIHLTSRYREEIGSGHGVDEAVSRAINSVGIALALATVTTVVGFLTNIFNPVPALKDFGILAAVGIASAFLLMLTFVPAVRLLSDRRAERFGRLPVDSLERHGDRLLPRTMEKLAVVAERAPVATLVIALALGAAGWYGFSQLETRFSFTDFLPEDSEYVVTLGLLADEFGGGFGERTQVLVEATGDAGFDADAHNAMVDANSALARLPDVATIESPNGSFPNANSPISVLGQLLSVPELADPELLAAAGQAGLGSDLKVAAGADVNALYEALLTVEPEVAGSVIHITGGEVDAVLFDIQTTAGETVGALRDRARRVVRPGGGRRSRRDRDIGQHHRGRGGRRADRVPVPVPGHHDPRRRPHSGDQLHDRSPALVPRRHHHPSCGTGRAVDLRADVCHRDTVWPRHRHPRRAGNRNRSALHHPHRPPLPG
jgi:uncharacterized protein